MSLWASPTITDPGTGGWSGGHSGAWWDYPTPLGPPKQVSNPRACYAGKYAYNDSGGEWYWIEWPCPLWFGFGPKTGIPDDLNPP